MVKIVQMVMVLILTAFCDYPDDLNNVDVNTFVIIQIQPNS